MGTPDNLVALARRFDTDRRHLRSVAFGVLGAVADADDAVQSAWLKVNRSDPDAIDNIDNLTGWFTTITAHEAVDQLRARKRRAEQPLAGTDEWERFVETASAPADEDALLMESIGSALLVVLDRLSPAQRVAFVLHDVFAMPFEEVADLLHRSPGAAKKLASRARGRLHGGSAPQGRTAEHLEVVRAFLAASRGGDIATLLELLAPGVVRRVDRSLVPEDVPTELRGARAVAEETRRFAGRARAGVVLLIDKVPGIVIAPRGRAQVLLLIGFAADNRIQTVDITADADRIRSAVLALPIGYPHDRAAAARRSTTTQERVHHAR